MKKNRFLFVAMLFAALSLGFVSCDDNKGNEPDDPATEQGGSTENNGGEETPTPEEPVTFTLTLLSSNEAMGIVTEGGTYNKDAEVIIEATATKEACVFVKWSDGNTENPRTLTMTENLTLTAEFDYAYVDLGLSVKWAKCNVGADSVHHSGGYYAWGEVEPKEVYDWTTYKWKTSEVSSWKGINKYTVADGQTEGVWYDGEGNFIGDNKTVLDPEDDAAAVNMGGSWRMPTSAEQDELRTECTWTWTDDYNGTGVEGCIVTSKINDNHIFLPAAGFYEAIVELPREVQGEVLTAIVEYGLYGETTESLKPIAKAMMLLIKPQIDANQKRYENGCKGGRPRKDAENQNQKETNEKPKRNQTQT